MGYPQLSAIIECADAAHGLGGHIIGDGGCKVPGDVAKAFWWRRRFFVMLGGMFAGHDESGGEMVKKTAKIQIIYGMSSKTPWKNTVVALQNIALLKENRKGKNTKDQLRKR